ncbi:putative histone deacetylase [Helianthus annuus]|nr:putative histone deacetylase [Helianthus annuus]
MGTQWSRFWPLCLMSSLLMEFFYSTYLLQMEMVRSEAYTTTDIMGFCVHKKDVHHGNGTQEIYKQNKTVLNVSLHRHEGGKFYPGTGTGAVHEFGSMGGEGYYVNIPWSWGGVRDNDYIFAFEHIVLPLVSLLMILQSFQLDLMLQGVIHLDAVMTIFTNMVLIHMITFLDMKSTSSADSFNRSSIGETVVHPLLTSLMQSVQATNNHKRFSHSEVPLW